MSSTTGLVLAVGGITIVNRTIFNGQPWEWKVPIATGIAAVMFSGVETFIGPELPRALAMMALVAVTMSRVDPSVPSPAESALKWWNSQK